MISILIADAHYLVRVGLKHILANRTDLEIAGEAADEQSLLALMEKVASDVVIIDYTQSGAFSISSIELIRQRFPNTGILIISNDNQKETVYSVLELGVTSFITKSCVEREIIDGIKAAATAKRFFCKKVLDYIFERSFSDEEKTPLPVTAREIEIIQLTAQGLTAKEVASQLTLSTHTIYTHRKNIMRKLNIKSNSELVLYAVREGLV